MSVDQAVSTVAPKKKGLFRGWYIVSVAFASHFAFATALPSTLGVFYKPMSDQFGWPRSYLSGVRSVEAILNAIIVAFLGSIIDRYGSRVVMCLGGIIGGVGLILTAFVNDGVQFFLVRTLLFCVGYTLFSHMVTSITISNWFVRKRGRALGIAGAGQATGKIFMAPLVTLLMGIWGWRMGWVALGVLVLILIPIPSLLILRRRPEDVGLRPDGDDEPVDLASVVSTTAVGRKASIAGEAVWTRREAVSTSAFWLIVVTFAIGSVGYGGFALHVVPYMTDIGFSPVMAATALSIQAMCQVVGTLAWGFIVERFPIRFCAMIMFLIQASGIAILLWLRDPVLAVTGLCVYGFSLAGNIVLQDLIWANYFGRLSLGTIRSIGAPILMAFSAMGPLYFGYLYDATGSYDISFVGFISILLVASVLVLSCRPPKRKPRLVEI